MLAKMRAVAVVALLSAAGASAAGEKTAPVQKVIEMMNDMMAKAKQEKQDEKMRFAAYSQFCKSTAAEKKKAIEKGETDMEAAEATIAEAHADVKDLGKQIAAHTADIDGWTAELEKATELRAEENHVFKNAHQQAVDSLESTIAAEKTLEKGNVVAAQAALLQLSAKIREMPEVRSVADMTAALLQDGTAETGAPQAAAYEGSSDQVIEIVESVEDKLRAEKKELETREGNSLNAFNLQAASLKGQIKKAQMESEMKASMKAQREQDHAGGKGALSDATKAHAEDSKFLADLDAECKVKTKDFHKRQEMRKGEIEAIMKAIEIMSSPEVAGGTAHTFLAQQATRSSTLAQLRSGVEKDHTSAQHLAAIYLSEKSRTMNSRVLSLLAVRASSDPFAKVIKMVKDMITKLMEEANEEAEHKGFCDTEMGTNKMTRDTKTALVAQLQATIEELSADINKLAQRESESVAEIAEIDAAMTKATAERQAEKEKNQQTLQDSKMAQAATQKATQVLKTYYESAANQVDLPEADGPIKYDPRSLAILSTASGGAALVQSGQKVPGAPEMESGKYTGMEGGGIMGLLEVIESDFAKVISETEASESESVRVFEQFSNDSAQDKAVKNTELTHQQDTKTAKMSDLQEAKKDLRGAQAELQAAMDYYEKLKPSCVEVAVSYEDRVAARKEEIESLKEALTILSGDDIA